MTESKLYIRQPQGNLFLYGSRLRRCDRECVGSSRPVIDPLRLFADFYEAQSSDFFGAVEN